jgi:hypothetical protein
MSSTTLSTVIDGAIGLAVIIGGIILVALSKIDAQTGIAVIGAGVLAAKGATSAALALKVPTPAQTVTTPAVQPVQPVV